MKFLLNLSVGKKLYGLVGVMLAFLVLLGVLAIRDLDSSASLGTDMYGNATVPIERLMAVETKIGNLDADVLQGLVSPPRAKTSVAAFAAHSAELQKALSAYHSTSLSSKE